jgi:membrane protein DedA with SNARE-associated domain
MSRVRYRSFLLYNVLGGVVWGTTFVLLGYGAGRNWKRVEALVSRGGLALVAAIVLGFWIAHSFRKGALAGARDALRRARSGS